MKFYKYGVEVFNITYRPSEHHWKKLADIFKNTYYFIFAFCKWDFKYLEIYYDGIYHNDIKFGFIEINFGYNRSLKKGDFI